MVPGLGPVFALEWSLVARRWQTFALRSALVFVLLLALIVVWLAVLGWKGNLSHEEIGRVGRPFFIALVGTQLALVMLAAPAATAGAICLDKTRGNLQHLMTTDLRDAEIVLGKLAARLIPVLGLVLCSMPVLAMAAMLGGIDLEALLGAYVVTFGIGVLGCSLALALSLWGRKTHEVLLLNYLIWALLLLAYPIANYLETELFGGVWVTSEWALSNPFVVAFLPYMQAGRSNLPEAAIMLGVCMATSVVLTGVTVLLFRRVILSQAGRSERAAKPKRRRLWDGWDYLGPLAPTLDGNPVLWREWRRRKLSLWMRVVWGVYILIAVSISGLTAAHFLFQKGDPGFAAWVNALQVPLGLVLVALTAVTCLVEERIRGSLDVLLSTPLTTASIVWGKWWGAFRPVPLLMLAPSLVALPLAYRSGHFVLWSLVSLFVLAHGAAIVSLGIAVAVWVKQQGRAIGIVTGIYVIMTLAVPLTMLAAGGHTDELEGPSMLSTFFGMGSLTFFVSDGGGPRDAVGWIIFSIGFHAGMAVLLGGAAAVTFDYCLGRVSDDVLSRPAFRKKSQSRRVTST